MWVQIDTEWHLETQGRSFYALTARLRRWLEEESAEQGWLHLFLPHTSAALALQEDADPEVLADCLDFLQRLVPDDDPRYRHRNEGPDDMAAHLRMMLGQNSLSIPVRQGQLQLGTWQGIFLLEHRERPQRRRVLLSFVGRRLADV